MTRFVFYAVVMLATAAIVFFLAIWVMLLMKQIP